MTTLRDDYNSANVWMVKEVIPLLSPIFPRYEFDSLEDLERPLARLFDLHSGIDYIAHKPGGGIKTFAARAQMANNYDTFTIRSLRSNGHETELHKRLSNIANNELYPTYTIQAYSQTRDWIGGVDRIAVVQSIDLYRVADEMIKTGAVKQKSNGDGTFFFPIEWEEFWDRDLKIAVYRNGKWVKSK